MSKHIAVLVTDMVEEIELTSPVEAYKEAGHTVDIISDEASKKIKGTRTVETYKEDCHTKNIISDKANKKIKGKNGDIIEADKGIADVNASDYDALLVPGGFSPDILRINPDNSAFAKEFFTED